MSTIRLDFKLNYGVETAAPPTGTRATQAPDYGNKLRVPLSTHRLDVDGFQVVVDEGTAGEAQPYGQLRFSTDRFRLDDDGDARLRATLDAMVKLGGQMQKQCAAAPSIPVARAANPDDSVVPPGREPGRAQHYTGLASPQWMRLHGRRFPSTPLAAVAVFPLGLKDREPHFRSSDEAGLWVGARPRVTMDIPLASVGRLVDEIQRLGHLKDKARAGQDLTGGRDETSYRRRSTAIVDAYQRVRQARTDESDALVGFLTLLVSYLYAGELGGDGGRARTARDFTPVCVRTHFRHLYTQALDEQEQKLFRERFADGKARDRLYALARRPGSKSADATPLFPSEAHDDQRKYFSALPTWQDLVERTIGARPPLLMDQWRTGGDEPYAATLFAHEALFTPGADATNGAPWIVQGERRVRGVRLELRRLGFDWVRAENWNDMAVRLFELARGLQAA